MNFILALDERIFLFLNSLHTPFLDVVMWQFSEVGFWIPLYVFLLWKLYKEYRINLLFVILCIALLVLITDQCCNLAKYSFMRLRPTHENHLEGIVHIVNNYRGGMYGFYSGHASNTFALAVFVLVALKKEPSYLKYIVLTYALLTSYSRIYLGVHYPFDILVGATVGCLLGWLMGMAMYKMYPFVNEKLSKARMKK